MLAFPNAKINIGLHITSKRPDGYHNIESCFYPIPWRDALEIIPASELKFTTSGLSIPGSEDSNLCLKAYHLLKHDFDIPAVHIHLHKVIPMGAGLGGGSADGAFTLKLLNDLFELGISNQQLEGYASRLGADCPFFIENLPKIVRGIGEIFSPCPIDLTGKVLLIKNPGIHIGTKEAYANVVPKEVDRAIEDTLSDSPSKWVEHLKNDFEVSVFPNHPELETLKNELYDLGATYASMTGSGSTVYGLFNNPVDHEGYLSFTL